MLMFKCKRCNHVEDAQSSKVYTNHITTESTSARVLINKDITRDPTLPRNTSINCSNCGFGESVYMTFPSKNEDEAMRLIFVCCNSECLHVWQPDLDTN